jgi:hypothetical protein
MSDPTRKAVPIRAAIDRMSKFVFTRKPNTTMVDVWYDNILIGELSMKMEKGSDKHTCTYRSYTNHGLACIGEFESPQDACEAILKEHRVSFNKRTSVRDPCLLKK